ncbi:MAG: N-6 DNA methylase [Thermoguttaceae bacterium]|nr:N-6 DNA methylase [Thermoguttaceae bacterium]
MKKITITRLESFLKSQCDTLRSAGLEATEYKDFLIAMIFLKRVNDCFVQEQNKLRKKLKRDYPDWTDDDIEKELEQNNQNEYDFFVPVHARWHMDDLPKTMRTELLKKKSKAQKDGDTKTIKVIENELNWRGLLTVTEQVGDAINTALHELEKENKKVLDGVFRGTNYNLQNSKGEKKLADPLLVEMIRDFNEIQFNDDNFEFPDLLGAAYEYLIKYFAESAGKKGGEFYTPAPVVELMAEILRPEKNSEIYDPTVGSGGLLIRMRDYVESRYGTARNLSLYGQELIEVTYRICRMNMIFHGIHEADIQIGDTLRHPKHIQDGKLKTFDIVVANPPFSQNYTTEEMEFKERFLNFTSKKKQADFMFVQHMIAVLKPSGRMAVIMPNGVLFRGGKEKIIRERLIKEGILECVISLPPSLFYGTTIPAVILVINKSGAAERGSVLFINADREYKEGKNQNSLRPEDIDKIAYVYHKKHEIPKYSRLVSKDELEGEDFNCNIRRYVDNTPEPENQDVQAHLTGGVPCEEIDALDSAFASFTGLKGALFTPVNTDYCQFVSAIREKADIRCVFDTFQTIQQVLISYTKYVDSFFRNTEAEFKAIPKCKDSYSLISAIQNKFLDQIRKQKHPVLDEFQIRGVFATFLNEHRADFKSAVASGWSASLIPDDLLLEDQAKEVLDKLRKMRARCEEIEGLFQEVDELEDDAWNPDDYQVIPEKELKPIKAEIKQRTAEKKAIEKDKKQLETRIKAYQRTLKARKSTDEEKREAERQIAVLQRDVEQKEREIEPVVSEISSLQEQIDIRNALEEELKQCRVNIRTLEQSKDKLVEQASEKITSEESEIVILNYWKSELKTIISDYFQNNVRALCEKVQAIYEKYAVTLPEMIKERDKTAAKLSCFLKELGYNG